MVYYENEYHLFYQHTPFASQPDFGRMHWGACGKHRFGPLGGA
ncbi:hypothetical protein ACFSQ7_14355 [Paenibacillus rhizoplanae]